MGLDFLEDLVIEAFEVRVADLGFVFDEPLWFLFLIAHDKL